MSFTLRTATVSAALVGLFVLPACGSDDEVAHPPASTFGKQTAAEIGTAVRSDMATVRSLRLKGESAGQSIDISLADDGTCVGSVEQFGGSAKVIETADGSYVKGDDAYWRGQATTDEQKANVEKSLKIWDGRWVFAPRDLGYLLPQCDFANFVPVLTSGDRKLAEVGQERTIHGVDAVSVVATQNGVTSTLWISTEAPHRVVELTEAGADAATYSVSNYDEPLDIKTPDPDEVFDLAAANKKAE